MRLGPSFYEQDVLVVAKALLGKRLVRCFQDGQVQHYVISETEAYRGEEDGACHANKGRTARTEVMYHGGGVIYVYLIYGMYWMLNVVAGKANYPQAVLIRGVQEINGPGRVGRELQLDKSFYGESLLDSKRLWIEDTISSTSLPIKQTERIGIDYAVDEWRFKKWRFVLDQP